MSFYQDRQIRGYGLFLVCFSLCIVGMGLLLSMVQMELAKASYLSHNAAIATALFEQDIPSTVIAAALTSAEISEEGTALLAMAGVDATAESSLLPFHAQLQRTSIAAALGIAILLVIALLAGSWVFFSARKRLYCHADQAVSGYLCGDYSQHLPRSSEGAIYQIFAQVEQLATMLQAKTETEHQAKEFLKKSISDISHQLKTPLAALTMYQEIIADEPEHPDTVREFSAKMSVSLKRMEYLIQAMLKITRLDTGNGGYVYPRPNLTGPAGRWQLAYRPEPAQRGRRRPGGTADRDARGPLRGQYTADPAQCFSQKGAWNVIPCPHCYVSLLSIQAIRSLNTSWRLISLNIS